MQMLQDKTSSVLPVIILQTQAVSAYVNSSFCERGLEKSCT